VLALVGALVAPYFDAVWKTVVVFYEFDAAAQARFQQLLVLVEAVIDEVVQVSTLFAMLRSHRCA
jgi:hypothetical protein